MELIFIIGILASEIERHDFEFLGFSGFEYFGRVSFSQEQHEVLSIMIADPVILLNLEYFETEMMFVGWDKVFILDFGVDGDVDVDDPVILHVAVEPDCAGKIPLAELLNVAGDVEGLAEVELFLADKAVGDVGHCVVGMGGLFSWRFLVLWQILCLHSIYSLKKKYEETWSLRLKLVRGL